MLLCYTCHIDGGHINWPVLVTAFQRAGLFPVFSPRKGHITGLTSSLSCVLRKHFLSGSFWTSRQLRSLWRPLSSVDNSGAVGPCPAQPTAARLLPNRRRFRADGGPGASLLRFRDPSAGDRWQRGSDRGSRRKSLGGSPADTPAPW